MPVKAGSESRRQVCKPVLGWNGNFRKGMSGGKCPTYDVHPGCVSCAGMLLPLMLSQDLISEPFERFELPSMFPCRVASQEMVSCYKHLFANSNLPWATLALLVR